MTDAQSMPRIKRPCLTALAASLLLLILCTAASADSARLGSAQELMKQGDYSGAVPLLRAEADSAPDDPHMAYYLGMALNRSHQGKEAESILKRALMAMPEDPALNLELGILYYNKSVYEEAEDYFGQTIQLAPDSKFAVEANDYLKKGQRRGTTKPWEINFTAGVQYDSNVILNGENSPLPSGVSGKSDWSGVFNLKGSYKLLKTATNELAASYNLYQSVYNSLHDYNISHHLLEVAAVHELSANFRLKAGYSFEYLYLGGESFDYANSVAPSLLHISENWGTTSLGYRFRDTRYKNTTRFTDNAERNGNNNQVSATHLLPLGNSGALWASYAFDRDITRRDFWDYRGNRLLIGGQILLPLSLSATLSGDVYWKKYDSVDPSFSITRDDTEYTVSLAITKNFTESYGLTLGQVYVRNRSNIDHYDYTRSLTTLLFNARF